MEINNGTLFKVLENVMSPHAKITRGTYNPQDPTQYKDSVAFVSFWYNPLAKGDEYPDSTYYEIKYHDVTWGVELYITNITENGHGIITGSAKYPFVNGIYLDHQSDKLTRDVDVKLVQNLILAMITDGKWSNKRPTFINEDDEPEMRDHLYV